MSYKQGKVAKKTFKPEYQEVPLTWDGDYTSYLYRIETLLKLLIFLRWKIKHPEEEKSETDMMFSSNTWPSLIEQFLLA